MTWDAYNPYAQYGWTEENRPSDANLREAGVAIVDPGLKKKGDKYFSSEAGWTPEWALQAFPAQAQDIKDALLSGDIVQEDGKWYTSTNLQDTMSKKLGVGQAGGLGGFLNNGGGFWALAAGAGSLIGAGGLAGYGAEGAGAGTAGFAADSPYWSMGAEAGTTSDAAAAGAGSFASDATSFGSFLPEQYAQNFPGMSVADGAFTGDINALRNIASPQYAMNIPGISTAAGAAALPGVIQGAGAAASGWSNFLTDLTKPSTLLPLVGQGIASAVGANAAGNALEAQTAASGAAISESRRQYDQTRADFEPWRTAGTSAIGQLATDTLGPDAKYTRPFSMADLNADPVYNTSLQFGMDEGRKAIERRARAMGINNSGGTMKALDRFAVDYVGTKAGDSFNRFETARGNAYNRVAGVAGTGQSATGTVAQAGQNTANNVAQTLIGEGNARGAASIAQANAITGGVNNLSNYFQNQEILKRLPLYSMS